MTFWPALVHKLMQVFVGHGQMHFFRSHWAIPLGQFWEISGNAHGFSAGFSGSEFRSSTRVSGARERVVKTVSTSDRMPPSQSRGRFVDNDTQCWCLSRIGRNKHVKICKNQKAYGQLSKLLQFDQT